MNLNQKIYFQEKKKSILEILTFIAEEGILNFSELVDYVIATNNDKWFMALVDQEICVFLNCYLSSLEKIKEDYQMIYEEDYK